VAAAGRAGLAAAWAPGDLAKRRARVTAVDVRDDASAPTIAGAVRVPLPALRGRLDRIPGRTLVFLCDTGRWAYLAARIAGQRGREVAYLSGGLDAWTGEGRPLRGGRS
jgi:rhodanese-related sulfurtransferase